MLDVHLRRIVPKAAGTYFIVRDKSQVTQLENENKMRLFFINTENGPTNIAVTFVKGDKTGFTNIFGKSTRKMLKAGNYSIETCLSALEAGPITVINLRNFTNDQKVGIVGFPSNSMQKYLTKELTYSDMFSKNNFWIPNDNKLTDTLSDSLLSFSNVGNRDVSVIVRIADENEVKLLTNEGDKTLASTSLEIEDFPALNPNTLLKDTFVAVYVFNNTFENKPDSNPYFGNLFDSDGEIVTIENIEKLITIPESGFVGKYFGTLIPNLINENNLPISIDKLMNRYYMETGVYCNINEDLFEVESDKEIFDLTLGTIYQTDGTKKDTITSSYILSQKIYNNLTKVDVTTTYSELIEIKEPETSAQLHSYIVGLIPEVNNKFKCAYGVGLKIGDTLMGATGNLVRIVSIEKDNISDVEGDSKNYPVSTYTTSGDISFTDKTNEQTNIEVAKITKVFNLNKYGYYKPTKLSSVKIKDEQILGRGVDSDKKLNNILDMINQPGIVKGIKGLGNIKYVIDCFRSPIESGYKRQYGYLVDELDKGNCFVRAILNDISIEALMESVDPLFKQTPDGTLNLRYLSTGGNTNYSTKIISKPTVGADKCYFFMCDNRLKSLPMGVTGEVSNLFYLKENSFDVIANETGILDNIKEIGYQFDDEDRKYIEDFNSNPIIKIDGRATIFGNLTGLNKRSANQQIHNSELLAFIKETLNKLSKSEAFKKGNYDDYLRTETESKTFMESLALAGAIEPNPVVICNQKNNTKEIRKQRIKVVHIEYTPIDALEKVVFDLTIN